MSVAPAVSALVTAASSAVQSYWSRDVLDLIPAHSGVPQAHDEVRVGGRGLGQASDVLPKPRARWAGRVQLRSRCSHGGSESDHRASLSHKAAYRRSRPPTRRRSRRAGSPRSHGRLAPTVVMFHGLATPLVVEPPGVSVGHLAVEHAVVRGDPGSRPMARSSDGFVRRPNGRAADCGSPRRADPAVPDPRPRRAGGCGRRHGRPPPPRRRTRGVAGRPTTTRGKVAWERRYPRTISTTWFSGSNRATLRW